MHENNSLEIKQKTKLSNQDQLPNNKSFIAKIYNCILILKRNKPTSISFNFKPKMKDQNTKSEKASPLYLHTSAPFNIHHLHVPKSNKPTINFQAPRTKSTLINPRKKRRPKKSKSYQLNKTLQEPKFREEDQIFFFSPTPIHQKITVLTPENHRWSPESEALAAAAAPFADDKIE